VNHPPHDLILGLGLTNHAAAPWGEKSGTFSQVRQRTLAAWRSALSDLRTTNGGRIMSKETPRKVRTGARGEPWKVMGSRGDLVGDANGHQIADCASNVPQRPQACKANAERIAACVNAFVGIPPASVERIVPLFGELMEALTAIVDFCDDPNGGDKPESLAMGLARLLPAARAAIVRAKGQVPS